MSKKKYNAFALQLKVDDKSNEITAIPALLDVLELTDCTVTIDGYVQNTFRSIKTEPMAM